MRTRAVSAIVAGVSSIAVLCGTAVSDAGAAGTPGALDPTFGNGGKVLSNLGSQAAASDALLQSNGDIVVSLELGFNFGVARYQPTGALDPTFGSGGAAQAMFNTVEGQLVNYAPAQALALQPDGKIVEVGEVHSANGAADTFGVVRFNANGTLDSSFGSGGEVTTDFFATPLAGVHEAADAVLVQPDGKILVAGSARQGQNRFAPTLGALARYYANGTLDKTFGNGGEVTLSTGGGITTLGLDAADDIFVLPAATELTPTGQVDASVTPATITSSSVGGPRPFLANGQSIAATTIVEPGNRNATEVQVQRLNAGGSLDSTFSSSPFKYTGLGTTQGRDSAVSATIEPNGKILVVGSHFQSTSVFGVARLNANGSLDSTFGNGGVLTTSFQGGDFAASAVVQPDGKIVVIGTSENNSTGRVDVALARYQG
jgi:uncharacterized delta-60 repeat protein